MEKSYNVAGNISYKNRNIMILFGIYNFEFVALDAYWKVRITVQ